MSSAEVAARHLRVVRVLPAIVEGAFRAALRESVLIRGTGPSFGDIMRERALKQFERASPRSSAGFGERELARRALVAIVDRFAASPLARRLSRMPVRRLQIVPHDGLDLIATAPNGRTFALRFVRAYEARLLQPLPYEVRRHAHGVSAVLTYAMDDGSLHRATLEPPLYRTA